jgi:tetratricopeptide (TPR) repeat protein
VHYVDIGRQWTDSRERSLGELRRVGRECIDLDPDFGPSHTAMGIYLLAAGEAELAIASFERGVELAPGLPGVRRWLALGLTQFGRYADAIRELEHSLSVGPEDPSVDDCFAMAFAQFGARRYEEAVSWAERGRRRQPVPNAYTGGVLAASLAHLGRLEQARSLLPGRKPSEERLRAFMASAAPEFVERLLDGLRQAGWISRAPR